MVVGKIDPSQLKRDYNILCQRLFPAPTVETTPFGVTYCVVEPNSETAPHSHHDSESFLILSGRGILILGNERKEVGEGDIVFIPPFSDHQLVNHSQAQSIRFLSIYWENPRRLSEEPPPKRSLIFSAPPTPNGALHLGHLSGPYVVADVVKRFLRLQGIEATYVTGTDDHQSYVPSKAEKEGLSNETVIEKYGLSIRSVMERIGALPDWFLHPRRDDQYQRFVQDFFSKLEGSGKLERRICQILFCETCQRSVYEAHVSGKCPHCEVPTNGNGCENCGITNDSVDLIEPKCNRCQSIPKFREATKYYFPLEPYKRVLAQLHKKAALPAEIRTFLSQILERPLPDISVTQVAEWGIAVPKQSLSTLSPQSQVLYEWFEMAAGYLYLGEIASQGKGYAHFWKDPSAEVIQCFGFDNSFFYLILVPALWYAFDTEIQMPKAFVVNQFYQLEGKKFSTSRQHAIWGEEILETVPSDWVRWYLGFSRPEGRETNFTKEEFVKTLRMRWIEPVGLMLESSKKLVELLSNTTPSAFSELSASQRHFWNGVCDSVDQMAAAYDPRTLSLNLAARELSLLVERIEHFLQHQNLLKSNSGAEHRTSQLLVLSALSVLGKVALPLLPDFGHDLLKALGQEGISTTWPKRSLPLLPEGKLECASIDSLIQKYSLESLESWAIRS